MPDSPRAGEHASPAPVVTGTPGSFAHGVLTERHPALIERVRSATAYGAEQLRGLDALLAEVTEDVLRPLPEGEPHAEPWLEWGRPHWGGSWLAAPFLWAESYFYRRLLAALGYFRPGPWRGVDPFEPFKTADLTGEGVTEELASLDALDGMPPAERDTAVLHASLWGNRADLGFRLSVGDEGLGAKVPGLIADDAAEFWSALDRRPGGAVHLVADNAGPELLPDLVLADHLLAGGRAGRVTLHVKPYPYFVSDATPADALACLRRMAAAPGARARATADRLRSAVGDGRLRLLAHPFAVAPYGYAEAPDELRAEWGGAALTVMKGDLNYRRLVGDRHWPADLPFREATAYFPGPVAALRTCKSDVVTGITATDLTRLDAVEPGWRTAGTHALVQVRG
ncbi:damage-control phosphatase ARMT1 family protein [Streptomyces sp. NPDC060194]|uniref:damage-control phosphatase ARMT1 family protein n=1 Tax=Streptomyces sp. NPDC060194 TaxID=3347069 RepID=UPI00366741C8